MATDNNILNAFDKIVTDARPCGRFYIVLWREIPFFGGHEEGGWWGRDNVPVKYTECATEEAAHALADRITELAEEMTADARADHGRGCLAQLAWCEERGIDDSNSVFGEDNGAECYYVTVQENPPEASYGDRHYS